MRKKDIVTLTASKHKTGYPERLEMRKNLYEWRHPLQNQQNKCSSQDYVVVRSHPTKHDWTTLVVDSVERVNNCIQ